MFCYSFSFNQNFKSFPRKIAPNPNLNWGQSSSGAIVRIPFLMYSEKMIYLNKNYWKCGELCVILMTAWRLILFYFRVKLLQVCKNFLKYNWLNKKSCPSHHFLSKLQNDFSLSLRRFESIRKYCCACKYLHTSPL